MSEKEQLPVVDKAEFGGESGISDAMDMALKLGKARVITVGSGDTAHTMITAPGGLRLLDMTPALDARAPAPRRIVGTATVTTETSFIELVTRHKTQATAIWAEGGETPKLTAVIDYHGKGDGSGSKPAWGEHRIEYSFGHTMSFRHWIDLRPCAQKEFFAFVDDHRFELAHPGDITKYNDDVIVEPAIGDPVRDLIIEDCIAQDKTREEAQRAKPTGFYSSPKALLTGIKAMSHTREDTVTEQIGDWGMHKLEIKRGTEVKVNAELRQYFLVRLAVYEGQSPRVLPVRLLVDASQGLQFGVRIVGLRAMREDAFVKACKDVEEKTGCKVFMGKPEAPKSR